MFTFLLKLLLLLSLQWISVLGNNLPSKLLFSWDTLPVYFHSSNHSGPWSNEAIKQMSRYPVVTHEKDHGGHYTSRNQTTYYHLKRKKHDYEHEHNVIHECNRMRNVSNTTRSMYYMNSVINWGGTRMYDLLQKHPDWRLKDKDGLDITPIEGSEVYAFNFSVPELRKEWINDCLYVISKGCDGCYVDQSPNMTQLNIHHLMTHEDSIEFEMAHMETLEELNEKLAKLDNKFAINNNMGIIAEGTSMMMIEDFGGTDKCINRLMEASDRGLGVQVHVGTVHGLNGTDDKCVNSSTNALAAFLLGAGKYSYYHCAPTWGSTSNWPDTNPSNNKNRIVDEEYWLNWPAEYDKPLGEPFGKAVLSDDGVWYRSFRHYTSVYFDTKLGNATIVWGDGTVQKGLPYELSGLDVNKTCRWQSMNYFLQWKSMSDLILELEQGEDILKVAE